MPGYNKKITTEARKFETNTSHIFIVININLSYYNSLTDVTLKHWVKKYGWKDEGDLIFIANQDENIKTKNITEKIEFEHLAPLMALL